jgi:hypothetical protein
LPTRLKILQNNQPLLTGKITLDTYINLIYKDIYARYLVSRGIGVEWEGCYADVGVMNGSGSGEYGRERRREDMGVVLDFVQSQAEKIKKTKTIGLYCYQKKHFVDPQLVNIERVKRMGYYVKEELTHYGRF